MTRLTLAAVAATLAPAAAMAHAGSVAHDHGLEGLALAAVAGLAVLGLILARRGR